MTTMNDETGSVAAILAAMDKAAEKFGAAPVMDRTRWNEAAGELMRLEDALVSTKAGTPMELAGKVGELAEALEAEEVDERISQLARSCAEDAAGLADVSVSPRKGGLVPLSEATQVRDWLTHEEVGERLGFTTATLKKWRVTGDGPKFTRLSPRRVVYFADDIRAWEASRPRVRSTTEWEQLEHGHLPMAAAAPDMLEALEAALPILETSLEMNGENDRHTKAATIAKVRAAIAKAKASGKGRK